MESDERDRVQLTGAAEGPYVICERRADGALVVIPDPSFFEPEINLSYEELRYLDQLGEPPSISAP